jgi:hypothetical protein
MNEAIPAQSFTAPGQASHAPKAHHLTRTSDVLASYTQNPRVSGIGLRQHEHRRHPGGQSRRNEGHREGGDGRGGAGEVPRRSLIHGSSRGSSSGGTMIAGPGSPGLSISSGCRRGSASFGERGVVMPAPGAMPAPSADRAGGPLRSTDARAPSSRRTDACDREGRRRTPAGYRATGGRAS